MCIQALLDLALLACVWFVSVRSCARQEWGSPAVGVPYVTHHLHTAGSTLTQPSVSWLVAYVLHRVAEIACA
jgi:hypothetical protein